MLEPIIKLTKDIRNASKILTIDEARFLVDTYYQLQDLRIATKNQERSAKTISEEPCETLQFFGNQFEGLETQIKGALRAYVKAQPIGQWCLSVKGIGEVIAAGIISRVDPLNERNKHPSSLWRYAGLAPGQKRRKGVKTDWNPALKRICWLAGESFVKVSNYEDAYYGKLYQSRKAQELAMNDQGFYAKQAEAELTDKKYSKTTEAYKSYSQGKLPLSHIHARAKRYAVKHFLADYTIKARELSGLEISQPWAVVNH